MQDKVVVITGANSGIGKETARGLAQKGARVVMVCRNPEKGARAAEEIRKDAPGGVDLVVGDLGTLGSTRDLAKILIDSYPKIDVLVNNAGVYRLRRTPTADGFEETFAVNHLAPFLLTNLLLDTVRASAPSRIVVVASDAHRGMRMEFDDLQSEQRYKAQTAYGRSKMANIMFTYALARRLEGTGVTVNALHPGFVASNFGSGNKVPVKPVMMILGLFVLSPKQGAETPIYLASSPDVDGVSGKYFYKSRPKESTEPTYDVAAQERLWMISEQLTGLA
ncbi:MAG: SDR family oxidoreductase [Actinomycetota bacterium]|nr:SDR family oxidoreductase [Actinomycetota bacterium]